MTVLEQYISEVMSQIPVGAHRDQIAMDLRAHLAERLENSPSVEDAIRQFGDPETLAESYLSSFALTSASFMSRAAAKLVDIPGIVIAGCVVVFAAWKLFGPADTPLFEAIAQGREVLIWICMATLIFIIPGYFILAEYLTGQTLGKRLLGLHVVRESGTRISLGQSIVRQIPLIGEFFVIDVLFAPFTEKKQRAFELISKTRVVRVDGQAA